MKILGINAFHGDVAAALVVDGELVAAVEEERFSRIKHCAGFPAQSVRECLRMAGLSAKDLDEVAVSRDPGAHRWRRIGFALRRRPRLGLVLDRVRNRSRVHSIASELADALALSPDEARAKLRFVEHHPAHLASAFYVSPFEDAAVAAIDGFGDFVSTSMAVGEGSELRVLDRTFFPHSLGILYLAITQYLGFPDYGDEFKVMGLAPYGSPACTRELGELLRLEPRGRFSLALPFFRHWSDAVSMTWESGKPEVGTVYSSELERLLGPARRPKDPITKRHQDIASSLQAVFEKAVFHVLNALHERTGRRRLCLAGGCAMNSVANGKIRNETPFEDVFVQPASGDNGTALGAAFYACHQLHRQPRSFVMTHGYWGPSYDAPSVEDALSLRRSEVDACEMQTLADERALVSWTAEQLAAGRIVGWARGRMEWGARALGNRSILADPRRADMREILNAKIKYRETFRPFAPAILEERIDDYFEGARPDPFMLHVYPIRPERRDEIPAVAHVDGTGRLQSVSRTSNPVFHALLEAFEARTGVPVLLNTSFNENEPIVQTPAQALDCFFRTDMDVLVLGDRVLEKNRGRALSASDAEPAVLER